MLSTPSKARPEDYIQIPAAPRAEGFISVPAGKLKHQVHWYEYGAPDGEPVMVLHGGPGGGADPKAVGAFDLKRYRVIMFDQRGCGKSIPNVSDDPKAALDANTTKALISDIEELRKDRGIAGKMHVFGGSWGTTLALAYGIAHPHNVQSLILRGIFLCRKKDLDYFYQGNASDKAGLGAHQKFPEHWQRFLKDIPDEERSDMVKAYAKRFAAAIADHIDNIAQGFGPGGILTENQFIRQWYHWEDATSYLCADTKALNAPKTLSDIKKTVEMSLIENHYFMNGAFLGGEGGANRDNNYLLDNIGKILEGNPNLPIRIVQGKEDQVTPRFQADDLIKALKKKGARNVEAHFTNAGHSLHDRENLLVAKKVMQELPMMGEPAHNPAEGRNVGGIGA